MGQKSLEYDEYEEAMFFESRDNIYLAVLR